MHLRLISRRPSGVWLGSTTPTSTGIRRPRRASKRSVRPTRSSRTPSSARCTTDTGTTVSERPAAVRPLASDHSRIFSMPSSEGMTHSVSASGARRPETISSWAPRSALSSRQLVSPVKSTSTLTTCVSAATVEDIRPTRRSTSVRRAQDKARSVGSLAVRWGRWFALRPVRRVQGVVPSCGTAVPTAAEPAQRGNAAA